MSWNYRILAFEYKNTTDAGHAHYEDTEVEFRICEVYYTKRGKPNGYTDQNQTSSSEGIKGLKWILKKHAEAIKKPILYAGKKFPKIYKLKK